MLRIFSKYGHIFKTVCLEILYHELNNRLTQACALFEKKYLKGVTFYVTDCTASYNSSIKHWKFISYY